MLYKRKNYLTISFIVAFICLLTLLIKNTLRNDDIPTAKSFKVDSKRKLLEQVASSPGLAKANLTSTEQSSVCRETLESIETLPLKAIYVELLNGNLKLEDECLLPQKDKSFVYSGIQAECEKRENNHLSRECLSKLTYFKAYRIHLALPGSDFSALPTDLLIQKFIGLDVAHAGSTSKGLLELRAAGAELYKRLPDSESAAMAAFLNYLESDPKSLGAKDRENYDALMNEAREKFPQSGQIFELDLVRQLDISKEVGGKAIEKFYANNPSLDVANYYMGCLAWSRELNAKKAQTYFKTALDLKPSTDRYKAAYRDSFTKTPPNGICFYQYDFDPDNF